MMSPPRSWAIIAFAASRETRNEPLAITSCCRSQSCTVVSSSGLDSDNPALLTTRSTPPKASTPAASACSTAASADTSPFTPPPAERRRPRVPPLPHGALVGPLHLPRARRVRAAQLVGHLLGVVAVQVGDH